MVAKGYLKTAIAGGAVLVGVAVIFGLILGPPILNGTFFCGEGDIQKENECFPDISSLDSNTILIHPIYSRDHVRIASFPATLVVYSEKNDIVTWINEADQPARIYEKENKWSIEEISPKTQKQVKFNQTAFYEYFVEVPYNRDHGRIAVVSNNTNLLPHYTKLEIARVIVEQDVENYPITGLGIGNVENALYVAIDPSELEKNADAENFFMKRYKNMIPFDVPIKIEFAEPAVPLGS